jgi:hypothetical protein
VAPLAELSEKTKYVHVGSEKFSAEATQTTSPTRGRGGLPANGEAQQMSDRKQNQKEQNNIENIGYGAANQ